MRNIGCTLCHLAFKTLGLKETFSSRWDENSLKLASRCSQKTRPQTPATAVPCLDPPANHPLRRLGVLENLVGHTLRTVT